MLWTLFVAFLILWILGLAHVYAIGGWLWRFFVIWVISLIVQLSRGKPTPTPRQ